MLYIAEVKRQTKGFIGGSKKAVLQLLACQRNDQSWSAVPGEEVVPCDDVAHLGDGALVMVNLANRQIQGTIEPAGAKVVGLLQNFSRALEKSRSQEEEIEEWRQSLTYQAQELNRREMELEASREQIERQEEELDLLDQRRQDLESRLEQLQQQQEQLGLQVGGATEVAIEAGQAGELQQSLGRLATALMPVTQVGVQVSSLQTAIAQKQTELDRQLGQDNTASASQLSALRQQIRQEQAALEQGRQQLAVCLKAMEAKQEAIQLLSRQLHSLGELRDALVRVAIDSKFVRLSQPVDPEVLEALSDSDLEARVATLEQDLSKIRPFVSDQEEELKLQLQSVEELERHASEASGSDRTSIVKELEEERDRYRFLEETLLGQRRTLKVREEVLAQHQRSLDRRRGNLSEASPVGSTRYVELGPILDRMEAQRNALEEELHEVESQTEQFQQQARQVEEVVELRARQQQAQGEELSRAEAAAPSVDPGRAYEQQRALLQMLQERVGAIAQPLQQADGLQQTITQLEELVRSLTVVVSAS